MRFIFIILFLVIYTSSCGSKKYQPLIVKNDFIFHKVDKRKITINIDKEKIISNWVVYQSNDEQLEFNIPEDWKINKKSGSVLFCSINDSDKNFFVLLVHDKKSNEDITLRDYFDYYLAKVVNDSLEVLTDSAKQFHFDDRMAYFLFLGTQKDSINYTGYSYLTEDENNIYDFTLKYQNDNFSFLHHTIFELVVKSFEINGVKLFQDSKFTKASRSIEVGIK